jgi:hypothetical protein
MASGSEISSHFVRMRRPRLCSPRAPPVKVPLAPGEAINVALCPATTPDASRQPSRSRGCPAAACLQKLTWRRRASPHGTLGLLSCRRPRVEDLRDSQGDREIGSRASPDLGVSRCRPQVECALSPPGEIFLPLARLPISRSPCKISIVRSDLDTPQKLLRFGLQLGSQDVRNRRSGRPDI